ncbi:ribonuclease H-like domain-containing protein, partial [Suillus bovinus]|uniref:ribonuclease H-like domain-containing protein n=1 Tax=Suillus bovinus TaxID=48563 RepID=UPI001B86EBA1
VCKLTYKTIHLTTIILPTWHGILKDLLEPQTLMPCDVATRWNLMFDMLDYALEHCEAIDTITQRRDLGLRKYELEDNEWEILQQLRDILKILKDATLYFSCATPNLAMVIPAMDHVNKMLTSYLCNKKYMPSIRLAVQLAKKTLNRYYQLTDRSHTYRISMVLHPQHKLSYFK